MRRAGLIVLVVAGLSLVNPAVASSAAAVSVGCQNAMRTEPQSGVGTLGLGPFLAGETVVFEAATPASNPPPTQMTIGTPDVVVSGPFPGRLTYTLPADVDVVLFSFDQGGATIAVDCIPPAGACTITGAGAITGTAGDDVICGSEGPDRIFGLGGDDTVFGEGGHDQLTGGDGDDLLVGGDGNDALVGGNGHDLLAGEGGHDQLTGGEGSDLIVGGNGNDLLAGGGGDDVLDALDGAPGDYAVGGAHSSGDICGIDTGDSQAQCEELAPPG